jgi:hypothetical protein
MSWPAVIGIALGVGWPAALLWVAIKLALYTRHAARSGSCQRDVAQRLTGGKR